MTEPELSEQMGLGSPARLSTSVFQSHAARYRLLRRASSVHRGSPIAVWLE